MDDIEFRRNLENFSAFARVGIIGMGAWGSAVSLLAAPKAAGIVCYAKNYEKLHSKLLPYQDKIEVVGSFLPLREVDLICISVPAQAFRSVMSELSLSVDLGCKTLLICSKGIENETCALMSDISDEVSNNAPVAVLSGPNFASEVMLGKPAATVIACQKLDVAAKIINAFSSQIFRPYYSDDIYGVQICGAAKNVIAIAAGVISALDFGQNAHAALIARGLVEIGRLITRRGGQYKTLNGLAGVGDLVLTCGSNESRNRKFGSDIITTKSSVQDLVSKSTVEGYYTAKSLYDLGKRLNIDMPIVECIYELLYEGGDAHSVIERVLSRPLSLDSHFYSL